MRHRKKSLMKNAINDLRLKIKKYRRGVFYGVDLTGKETFVLGDTVNISGWCFHRVKRKHDQIQKLILHIGDISVGTRFPSERRDLRQHFAGVTHCEQSGFTADVRLNCSGQKRIRIELVFDGKRQLWIDTGRVLKVENYCFNLDSPESWECLLMEKVTFVGWFFRDRTLVKKMIVHAGEENSVCTYGIERADVKKAHPNFPQVEHSGFYGIMSFESSGPKQICFEAVLENDETIIHAINVPLVVKGLIFNREFPLELETVVGQRVTFSGWCYHERKAIKQVILYVDDVPYECTCRLYREDVGKKFIDYPDIENSGFTVDLFFYSPGIRGIHYEIIFDNGEVFVLDKHKQLNIKPELPTSSYTSSGINAHQSYQLETAGSSTSAGINLIGYFSSIFGNAETARTFVKKIDKSGVKYSLFNLDSSLHQVLSEEELKEFKPYFCEKPPFGINLFFINADQLPGSVHNPFPYLFKDKYNIGVFWWEFDDYLDQFVDAFELIDHVVVFSDFVNRAVVKVAPPHVKITKLPYPFTQNWKITVLPNEIRKQYALNKDDFVFFFSFDFLSTIERKNPEAVVEAFSIAFAGEPNVKLVVKTNHSHRFSMKLEKLMVTTEDNGVHDQVIFIHDSLTRNRIMSLINSIDCYVSLHRSEGFGLGMAEAMYLGKPVVGTRYGGNLDFMNEDNSILIDYSMKSVPYDAPPYKKGWCWAEPDITEAANAMTRLCQDRQFAFELGKTAAAAIKSQFDDVAFNTELQALFESI